MLAYVFWHAPRSGFEPAAYAAALVRFHAALAADPPEGFARSFSTSVSTLPWFAYDGAYEDWYLIADGAALDALDAAAVDLRRRGAHDAASVVAKTGVGGLYRLIAGDPIVPANTVWFAKPVGRSYADFAPELEALRRDGATLWQRRMVLGPAPEFAAQTRGGIGSGVSVTSVADVAHVEIVRGDGSLSMVD